MAPGPVEPHSYVVTVRERTTQFCIARPDRRNALDTDVLRGLIEAFARAEADRHTAFVLTGGPEYFSSGGDVSSMPGSDGGLMGAADRLALVHDVVRRFTFSDLVVIGAVEGHTIGAAWGLVLACDLVVAAEDAWFAAPFAARGLTADAGTAWHLPRRLGHQRAAAHLYLGERLTAKEARAAGLVSRIVAPGTATRTALELAEGFAASARESNALTKTLTQRGRASELVDFLAAERTAVALAGHGGDAREGRAAFLERREPSFR